MTRPLFDPQVAQKDLERFLSDIETWINKNGNEVDPRVARVVYHMAGAAADLRIAINLLKKIEGGSQ